MEWNFEIVYDKDGARATRSSLFLQLVLESDLTESEMQERKWLQLPEDYRHLEHMFCGGAGLKRAS